MGQEVWRSGAGGDSGFVVFIDLGKGVEKQAGDVGEDGGAACGDFVLGQELVELAEGVVDALGGLELLGIAGEVVEVVGVFELLLFGEMVGTETGLSVSGQETAAAASGREIGTAERSGRAVENRERLRFAMLG